MEKRETVMTLYSYYVERDGAKEIRSINDYSMNADFGDQARLEAFLRARCTKVEFLGNIRFICDLSRGTIEFLAKEPGALKLRRNVYLKQKDGARMTNFFEEGTDWLDSSASLQRRGGHKSDFAGLEAKFKQRTTR